MKDLMRTHASLLIVGVATFVLMGAGQSLFGPALPVYARDFGLSDGQIGLPVAAFWVGCFLGVGFMYLHGARIGARHVLAVMALGTLPLTLAGILPRFGWSATLAGALVYGAGYGMATAVFNPRVMVAFGDRGPSMLSLLNATFGIGAIAAPLLFVLLGSNPGLTFGLVTLAILATLASAGPMRDPARDATVAITPFRPHWGILAFGTVAIGLEASFAGLGPTALIRAGVEETSAATLTSAYFVVFLLARVVLIFTAHRIAPFALYTLAVAAAAVCALGAVFLSPALFFVALGVSAGLFFPGYYVTAAAKMGNDPRVPPTIVASGLVGAIGAPLLLAPLMARMGERGFFWLVAGITLALLAAALLSARRMRV